METSRRPKARPKNFGRKAAIEEAIARALVQEKGNAISDADKNKIKRMMVQELGNSKFNPDRQSAMNRAGMLEALEFGEMGMMSDADLARLRKELGMKRGGEVKKMKKGGLVENYEYGGEVKKKKGKGKKSGSSCRGAGAAVKGTRFSGIR